MFNLNYQKIQFQLSNPSRTFDMGMNQFMTLTMQEFIQTYLGTNPADNSGQSFMEKKTQRTLTEQKSSKKNKFFVDVSLKTTQNSLPTNNLPASVDWRAKGAVTPVKNQGNCGSCWAFSATGAMESLSFIKGRGLPSLSEQQLVDCSGSDGNYGGGGGLMDNAFRYARDIGMTTEAAYPYISGNGNSGTCKAKCGYFKISGLNDVPAYNDLQLAAAIAQQPVSVAVDANNFQFYSSGIFSSCSTNFNVLENIRKNNNNNVVFINFDEIQFIIQVLI